jgi:dTDP-4-dehydrorhamnose 3,5-epimerase
MRPLRTPPLPTATKDEQSVTSEWQILQDTIEGVRLVEVRHIVGDTGHLTEVLRQDWFEEDVTVDQVFQVTLEPGAVSGWHVHLATMDRLFVNTGQIRIALYDGREDSPTHGRVNEFRLGELRPGLLVIPAGVWHGLRNLRSTAGTVLNLVDRAYAYEDPDHWRLPADSPEIPYSL